MSVRSTAGSGRFRLASLALVSLLLSTGCGSDDGGGPIGPGDPLDPGDPGDPGDPAAVLECESRGYPCSFSGVDLEILERTDSLGDEALAMLEAGQSMEDVAGWLEERADVEEVQSDDRAVRFRLEGGRGLWIWGPGVFAVPVPHAAPPAPPRPLAAARDIVGPGTDEKRALVLAPAFWEMGKWDDAPAVADVLSGTRGYEGRVNFLFNPDSTSSDVGIDAFRSWDQYHVIHVSTHGKRVCDAHGCRATINVGLLDPLLPPGPGSKEEKLHELAHQGVEYAKGQTTGREYLVLSADFFRMEYGSGLENTFVFITACQTWGPSDLVDAIQGSSSVVLAWDDAVYADDAAAASEAMYTYLSEGGYPAEVAWEKLGSLRTGSPTQHGVAPNLHIAKRPDGGDLRIRDVVSLLNPVFGAPLGSSSKVSIDGAQNDGEPDAAPFLVRVDGVLEEFAGEMFVTVSVDGEAGEPVRLTDGEMVGEDRWTVQGSVPLSWDLEDETAVTYEARVNLHSGGESDDEAGVTLTGEEPRMGWAWELEATNTAYWVGASFPTSPRTATATLTLAFEEGQDLDEPNPRYVIVDGTVTFDYNHVYGDCSFSAEVLTFDVSEAYTTGADLVFDTGPSPPRYHGYIFTLGPEFEVTSQCEDSGSTRTHKANVWWMDVEPGESLPVGENGTKITGTYISGQDFSTSRFVVETNYTITRLQ